MAAQNYILLERIELNASAASVTFASIPQTGYTDLKVVMSARTDRADNSDGILCKPNNSAANGTQILLFGTGSSAASQSASVIVAGTATAANDTSNTFGNSEMYIPNYNSTTTFKSMSVDGVNENNATTAFAVLRANLWSDTSAITSLVFSPQVGSNFVANSTFSLYGLAAVGTTPAIAPKAAGGDIIDYDGTYWIHTFTSSGTFTPQTGLTCDYLVVAGGGGAADQQGAGGAGGFRSTVTATGGGGSLESALSVAANTSYTVTVGAGGAWGGTINGVNPGSNGSNSVFSTITSTGGGAGTVSANGIAGGSGGGAGNGGGVAYTGGAGTANQGYAGGNAIATSGRAPGGGGGAGAVGVNGSGAGNGGGGGAGVASSISGSSVTRAGGGGGGGSVNGGSAGTGGGGAGGIANVAGGAGTTNTGGGGGGTNGGAIAGNGGSGIVIIRYLAA